jgi:hypothetical protein
LLAFDEYFLRLSLPPALVSELLFALRMPTLVFT